MLNDRKPAMTTNRLLMIALSGGILAGLLAIAQGMKTSPSEQIEAMPETKALNQ
tara:strand:- start:9 stop:170 length:162 start_codon:yes stop_codon:yes gene_type:complete